MNRVIITFLFFIGIAVSSCTTSKSVVSQNADLSKYEYASIINNDTYHIPAQLMEYENTWKGVLLAEIRREMERLRPVYETGVLRIAAA